jgi:hypothetical protein
MFIIFINRKLVLVTKHLPTRDCLIIERMHTENGFDKKLASMKFDVGRGIGVS